MRAAAADPYEKLARLKRILGEMGSVVVAYSGGVDSSFLLRAAVDTPHLRVVALTTDSPTNTTQEIEEAALLARELGVEHVIEKVNELDTPGYAENPTHRCYLCKQTLYPLCFALADRRSIAHVIDGVNCDDLGDYRPGLRAAAEQGVRHPLVEAELDKAEIRQLSRFYGLASSEKPASPCLSSRFPYGTRIDEQRLKQVARAEAYLRSIGFQELRVRHLGDGARVEVAEAEIRRLDDETLRAAIRQALEAIGFASVEISESALRSGSLNDVVKASESSAS